MKKITFLFFFYAIILSNNIAFSQTTIEWETGAIDNGTTITSTELAGVNITVSTNNGDLLSLIDLNGIGGSTGNVIYNNLGVATELKLSFDVPVNVISIYHFDDYGFPDTLTFTPIGGTGNSVKTNAHLANAGATAMLNWTGITSFTITGSTTNFYSIDELIAEIASDATDPIITVCAPTPSDISANTSCQATTPDLTGGVTATDNSGENPVITQFPVAGTTLGLGTTTITFTATDGSGNTSTCTVNQKVVDDTNPVISCPGNQTETPNGSGQFVLPDYTALAWATDNCSGAPAITQSPVSGTVITETTTIILTATDGASNSSQCTFDIVLTDVTPPVFENTTPSTSSITQTGFTLNTDIDEAGTIYYVVVADGASVPTAAEVKSGTGSGGTGQQASGNATVTTGAFLNDFSVTSLTSDTAYDVYVVAEDDEVTPNLQVIPTLVNITTLKPVAKIVISEIMYNPPEAGTDIHEYIELYNAESFTVDLTGYSFSRGVTHTFTSGSIGSGEYFVIAVNAVQLDATYGAGTADAQWTGGGLSNGGEEIELLDNSSRIVDYLRYDDTSPWPFEADGIGPSIRLGDITSDNSLGLNWSASDESTGIMVNGRELKGTPGEKSRIAPVFENSTPNASLITGTTLTLNTDIDEAGTIYYIVVADGSSVPTAAEVKSGTGSGGSGQITSGNAVVNSGDFSNTFNVTSLTEGTDYDLYVVAEDDDATPNLQVNPTKIDVTTGSLSINDVFLNEQIAIFPNPIVDKVHISSGNARIKEVVLIDLLGKAISVKLENGTINLSSIKTGVYSLKIIAEEGILIKKIIKI